VPNYATSRVRYSKAAAMLQCLPGTMMHEMGELHLLPHLRRDWKAGCNNTVGSTALVHYMFHIGDMVRKWDTEIDN
jgi:hypothetical protein